MGVGLARKIVADREARGLFGGLQGLDRVPGIGPGLLAAIGPHAAFSGQPVPPSAGSPAEAPATPAAAASPSEPPKTRTAEPLDLNTATAAELEELPFVGPYMAGQIVAHRARHGPFTAVDSLVRVPGIGPATLARIRERLRVLP
ncbi:MAG: helix-hairpin-helix domain-containing protein [Gemmatimonadetes bacterium]|nr:helix-hairpin-helix domain-containing protein [Gemmatimonadota bacterium]